MMTDNVDVYDEITKYANARDTMIGVFLAMTTRIASGVADTEHERCIGETNRKLFPRRQ